MKIRAAVLEEFGAPLQVQEVDLAVPPLVERYMAGDIDVDAFLSHRISLDEVNRGFELMEAQDGIRSVISFS